MGVLFHPAPALRASDVPASIDSPTRPKGLARHDFSGASILGPRPRWLVAVFSFGLTLAWSGLGLAAAAAADPNSANAKGEAVYARQCLSCHGKGGKGARSIRTRWWATSRFSNCPSTSPRRCPTTTPTPAPATRLGRWRNTSTAAFYSNVARARNQPARIELSRLTVRQYQNAVCDLIGWGRGAMVWDGPKGLQAQYYKTKRRKKDDRLAEQVDPTVEFDFDAKLPGSDKGAGREFFAQWQGGVLAPETGDYEFIVRTEHVGPALGQRRQDAVDRRLGQVGRRHRVPRVDPADRRPASIRSGSNSRRPSRG